MSYEVPNTFVPGNLIKSAEVNENFDYIEDTLKQMSDIYQVYTGTAINHASVTGTSSNNTLEFEFNDVTSEQLEGKNYLELSTNISMTATGSQAFAGFYITIQTKPLDGSYSDSLSETLYFGNAYGGSSSAANTQYRTPLTPYLHTLTEDEKDEGVKVKILLRRSNTGGNSISSCALIQAFLKGIR